MSIPGHFQQSIRQPGIRLQSRFSQTDRVLPDPWFRISQGIPDERRVQFSQAIQSPQSMNSRFGPAAAGGNLDQTIDGAYALTANEQPLGVHPPPHVLMGQIFHQDRIRGPSERKVRHQRNRLFGVGSDSVDSALPATFVKYMRPAVLAVELVGHPLRVLNDPAIVVHDVKSSVGSDVQIDRPEPTVGGGQEFRLFSTSAGLQRDPVVFQQIAVNQVVGRFGHKGDFIEWRGEESSQVDRDSTSRRKVARTRENSVLRVVGDGIDACGVIWNVRYRRSGAQGRVSPQISGGNDLLAYMPAVGDQELASPSIEAQSELGGAGKDLQLESVRAKAEIAGDTVQLRPVATVGESFRGTWIAEFVLEDNRSDRRFIGEIDPVVQSIDWRADRVLRVGEGEAGQNGLSEIGTVVAVRVLEVPDVGRISDQNAVLPSQHPRGKHESVNKYRASVGKTVPVGVFQQFHAPGRPNVQGIAGHLDDEHAAMLIEFHRNRVENQRFGGEELDSKALFDNEGCQGLRGSVGRARLPTVHGPDKAKQKNE